MAGKLYAQLHLWNVFLWVAGGESAMHPLKQLLGHIYVYNNTYVSKSGIIAYRSWEEQAPEY